MRKSCSIVYWLAFCLNAERKRRVYDQYGKEGLSSNRSRRAAADDDDYEFGYAGFPFTFRDPEEVFREFFRGSPFGDLFTGKRVPLEGTWIMNPEIMKW